MVMGSQMIMPLPPGTIRYNVADGPLLGLDPYKSLKEPYVTITITKSWKSTASKSHSASFPYTGKRRIAVCVTGKEHLGHFREKKRVA